VLAKEGKSNREIADLTGLSTQAVHGHLKRLRRDGELPEEGAA